MACGITFPLAQFIVYRNKAGCKSAIWSKPVGDQTYAFT
jgi:hypothetical protein